MWRRALPHLQAGPGSRAGVSGAAAPLPCVRQGRGLCRRSRSVAPRLEPPSARGPRHRPPAGTACSLREAAGRLPGPSLWVIRVSAGGGTAPWRPGALGTSPIFSCVPKLRLSSGFPELDPLFSFLKNSLCYIICTLGLLPTQAVVPNSAQVPPHCSLISAKTADVLSCPGLSDPFLVLGYIILSL